MHPVIVSLFSAKPRDPLALESFFPSAPAHFCIKPLRAKGIMSRPVIDLISLAVALVMCILTLATAFVVPPYSLTASSAAGDGRRTVSPAGDPLTCLAAAKKKSAGNTSGSGGSTSAATPSSLKKRARKGDEASVGEKGGGSHSFPRMNLHFYINIRLFFFSDICFPLLINNESSTMVPHPHALPYSSSKTGAGTAASILHEDA